MLHAVMEPQGRRGRFGSCAMQATLMSGSEPPSDHNLPEIPLEETPVRPASLVEVGRDQDEAAS